MTIHDFIRLHKITASVEWADSNPHMEDMPDGSTHYRVTLRCGRRSMTVPFSMGPAHTSEPTAAEALNCLASDASTLQEGAFEAWCDSLGYDTDSRRAERTYGAIQKQTASLERLLGRSDLDVLLCEVERS